MLLLQQDNESLTASLAISQGLEAILESKSAQLQTDLDASIASTTQIKADLQKATIDAKALEAQNEVLKIGGGILLAGLAALGIYEGGHALKAW